MKVKSIIYFQASLRKWYYKRVGFIPVIEYAYDDFTGITPISSAYTVEGVWMDFTGKNAVDEGPFGDADWWEAADEPIYERVTPG